MIFRFADRTARPGGRPIRLRPDCAL